MEKWIMYEIENLYNLGYKYPYETSHIKWNKWSSLPKENPFKTSKKIPLRVEITITGNPFPFFLRLHLHKFQAFSTNSSRNFITLSSPHPTPPHLNKLLEARTFVKMLLKQLGMSTR